MAFKLWTTFDDWTLTDCFQAGHILQMGGKGGHDFTVPSGLTILDSATFSFFDSVIVGVGVNSTPGGRGKVRVNGSSLGNGIVRARCVAGSAFGGIYFRGGGAGDGNGYFLLLRPDNGTLSLFRFDGDAATLLGSTAHTYHPGDDVVCHLEGSGNQITAVDETSSVTVGPITDATYSTGTYGVADDTSNGAGGTGCDWIRADSSALLASAVSPEIDLGSSMTFDVAAWDQDLSLGGTVALSLSLNAAPGSPAFSITGLTNPRGATFAAATGRYLSAKLDLTRASTAQIPKILSASLQIGKGFTPGGGGGTFVGGNGGFFW